MEVYKKVRAYIDENGIDQYLIAEKCGISASDFAEIMDGKHIMCADDLRAICLALNVSPEIFIDIHPKCVRAGRK